MAAIIKRGDFFGHWTATGDQVGLSVPCRCECGTERLVEARDLRRGRSRSCGCDRQAARWITPGEVFGRLTVLGRAGADGVCSEYLCRCECGVEAVVSSKRLREGDTVSCGCAKGHSNVIVRGEGHGRAKLDDATVLLIRRLASKGLTPGEIRDHLRTRVSRTTIRDATRGTTWTHLPLDGSEEHGR